MEYNESEKMLLKSYRSIFANKQIIRIHPKNSKIITLRERYNFLEKFKKSDDQANMKKLELFSKIENLKLEKFHSLLYVNDTLFIVFLVGTEYIVLEVSKVAETNRKEEYILIDIGHKDILEGRIDDFFVDYVCKVEFDQKNFSFFYSLTDSQIEENNRLLKEILYYKEVDNDLVDREDEKVSYQEFLSRFSKK